MVSHSFSLLDDFIALYVALNLHLIYLYIRKNLSICSNISSIEWSTLFFFFFFSTVNVKEKVLYSSGLIY